MGLQESVIARLSDEEMRANKEIVLSLAPPTNLPFSDPDWIFEISSADIIVAYTHKYSAIPVYKMMWRDKLGLILYITLKLLGEPTTIVNSAKFHNGFQLVYKILANVNIEFGRGTVKLSGDPLDLDDVDQSVKGGINHILERLPKIYESSLDKLNRESRALETASQYDYRYICMPISYTRKILRSPFGSSEIEMDVLYTYKPYGENLAEFFDNRQARSGRYLGIRDFYILMQAVWTALSTIYSIGIIHHANLRPENIIFAPIEPTFIERNVFVLDNKYYAIHIINFEYSAIVRQSMPVHAIYNDFLVFLIDCLFVFDIGINDRLVRKVKELSNRGCYECRKQRLDLILSTPFLKHNNRMSSKVDDKVTQFLLFQCAELINWKALLEVLNNEADTKEPRLSYFISAYHQYRPDVSSIPTEVEGIPQVALLINRSIAISAGRNSRLSEAAMYINMFYNNPMWNFSNPRGVFGGACINPLAANGVFSYTIRYNYLLAIYGGADECLFNEVYLRTPIDGPETDMILMSNTFYPIREQVERYLSKGKYPQAQLLYLTTSFDAKSDFGADIYEFMRDLARENNTTAMNNLNIDLGFERNLISRSVAIGNFLEYYIGDPPLEPRDTGEIVSPVQSQRISTQRPVQSQRTSGISQAARASRDINSKINTYLSVGSLSPSSP